jgi:glutamate/tyrosine decarboxylase-like PLP-dependent enzyme
VSDHVSGDESSGISAFGPGLLELGCMSLVAEMVLWTVAAIAIGISGSELWGYVIGVGAGALALGLMSRRWSGRPQREQNGGRRGGETFERETSNLPDGD